MSAPRPDRAAVDFLLHGLGGEDLVAGVRGLARASDGFDLPVAEALADHLEAGAREPVAIDGDGPVSVYLRARELARSGEVGAAIDALGSVVRSAPRESGLLGLRARWLMRERRLEEAVSDLRAAVLLEPGTPFFLRFEKLYEKAIASDAWTPRRRVRLAIGASSTTSVLRPVLRAVLFGRGIAADVHECAFGAYRQEILDPTSPLHEFRPDVLVLVPNHRDAALPPDGARVAADRYAADLRGLWAALRSRCPCHVVQVGVDLPTAGAWGLLEDTLPDGRRRQIARINLLLSEDLPAGVTYLDPGGVAAQAGRATFSDFEWHATKQYPCADALPAFAGQVAAHVRAAFGLSSKVLVLDLDHTMWGGIVGEDGVGGIAIGPPTAVGEAHAELQRFAREAKGKGVLLAVVSKNNLADAEAPFREHDQMVLRLDDFVAFRANWDDKASSLAELAGELSLGLDSFVFVDDNPIERAWVRERCPDVTVIEANSPWEMVAELRRGRFFEQAEVTREDRERSLSYRVNAAIQRAEASAGSLESFLASLEMVCEHGPVDSVTLGRVAQLVNKTNQFNLRTRRYTTEQVRAMAESPDWWCRWYRLSDRFGDHGLIGVLFARRDPGGDWSIDTWLMSCRVLGRRVEDLMAATVVDAARACRAPRVRGEYLPTPKNEVVRDLLPRLGFVRDGDGWSYDTGAPSPASPWITARAVGT